MLAKISTGQMLRLDSSPFSCVWTQYHFKSHIYACGTILVLFLVFKLFFLVAFVRFIQEPADGRKNKPAFHVLR